VFALASRLNRRKDLLSGFMVSLLASEIPHRSRRELVRGPGCLSGSRLLFFVLMLLAAAAGAAPRLEVSLDRYQISLGDSAVLTMNFSDCTPSGMPELPMVANLQYAGQSSEQSYSLNGSSMTRNMVYSVELHPLQVGTYVIPEFEETVNGVRLRSRPLTLKVVKNNVPAPGAETGVAFIKIVPETNVIYSGQILPVELQCYCQNRVENIQMPQLASDNFVMGELPNSRQQATPVQVGNATYNLFRFRTSVTAIKTGVFTLGPATWSMTVVGGTRTFFGWTESRQTSFTSDAPEIRVLAVPVDKAPPGFNGAIGQFALAQCEAGPASVGVGDPITLKIRITGRGAFDTVTLPTNNEADWREFKVYPSSGKFETSDPMRMEGAKYFEQVVTPQNGAVKEIPPFAFSFFDPAQGVFRTLAHAAIPVAVHATAATPLPAAISSGGSPEEQAQDIVHIKPVPGKLRKIGLPLVRQPAFLALQALGPLAWICALIRRKRKEYLANNPRLCRQRQVAEVVRKGLAELGRPAMAEDPEKFHATILRLLREQLGERLNLPAPAITEAVVDDLPKNELRPETPAVLHELFQACNQYQYAPEHAGQGMSALIPKLKLALQDLRSMPAQPGQADYSRSAVAALLLLLSATTLRAQPTADAFTQANKLYEEGQYAQSAAGYEKIEQAGMVSTALYFNLGNALLKSGQVGRAIRAYRQAEKLSPRDADVRANLQIARRQAGSGNPALPGNRWTRWTGRLTLNEWTAAAAAATGLFFIVLTIRELFPAFKKFSAVLTVLPGLAAIGLGGCLGVAVDLNLVEKSVVIIVPEAVARRGPLPEAQSVFTMRDGTELLVLGGEGDWLQVSDAGRHAGWLWQQEAKIIP
jgi:tetratricopeptide (TPR) repeat protein